jgi:hypothetical protein
MSGGWFPSRTVDDDTGRITRRMRESLSNFCSLQAMLREIWAGRAAGRVVTLPEKLWARGFFAVDFGLARIAAPTRSALTDAG